jgi:hypothetical protein
LTRARCHRFPTASRRVTGQVNQVKEREPLGGQVSLDLGKGGVILPPRDASLKHVGTEPVRYHPQLLKAARSSGFPHKRESSDRR